MVNRTQHPPPLPLPDRNHHYLISIIHVAACTAWPALSTYLIILSSYLSSYHVAACTALPAPSTPPSAAPATGSCLSPVWPSSQAAGIFGRNWFCTPVQYSKGVHLDSTVKVYRAAGILDRCFEQKKMYDN